MAAKWPTSVATDADLYVAVNSLQTTLATAINSSDTSVVLASATGFPTAGGFTIDNEVIFYTGVSGATLTGCTRGADGTTAASHSVGVPVGASIIAFHHNGLMAEIEAIESFLNTVLGKGTLVTATEFAFVHGVTSAIQTQMDLKAPLASPTFTGTVVIPSPFTLGATSVTASGTEMNRLVGVTSAIQTQLNLLSPIASPTFTGTVTAPVVTLTGASNALLIQSAQSGAVLGSFIDNTSNTASADARMAARVAGASAGDPFAFFSVSGATNWSIGIDNSDSDSFKISQGSALGTNDFLVITTAGAVTYPSSGGSGLRIYGGSGSHQWDFYLSGTDIRFSDNTSGGKVVVDTALSVVGDVVTVDTTNYGSTSTVVGWSSTTTKNIYYRKLGKRVDVWFHISGTSNATSITFTLPFTSSNTDEIDAAIQGRDNGSFLAGSSYVSLAANSATASCFKDFTGAAWTASATKSVQGQFWYYTA